MKDEIIVKRYADAFMSYAREAAGEEKACRDLKDLKETVIRDNPGFLNLLKSPEFSSAEKSALVDSALKEGFLEETRNFLKFLLEKERIDKLPDIAEYIISAYSHGKEVQAHVRSAFTLKPELIKAIQDNLESRFKKKIKLHLELERGLLGGIKIIIGRTVIDCSLARQLDEIKQDLMAVRV